MIAGARVMVCAGTRPEVIKLAPVIRALGHSLALVPYLVSTAQHRQMLDQMLTSFGLTVDQDLDLMRPGQELAELTSAAVGALGPLLGRVRPQALVVQGDTTTAMCAALAGFYAGVPVAHVEAGLRSGNPRAPFPEEINRRLIGTLARWHFCPTSAAVANLLAERCDPAQVELTGNTIVDALTLVREQLAGQPHRPPSPWLDPRRRTMLVTIHRRETQGDAQRALCRMLARLVRELEDLQIVLPVHPSPRVREVVLTELAHVPDIHLAPPLGYPEFVELMAGSHLILTDSGGVQEEAPSLGVPVLVMRETTERPEGLAAGCARLCGTDPALVERDIRQLLGDPNLYAQMAGAPNPYGDGHAARRIAARLERDLTRRGEEQPPERGGQLELAS